MTKSKETLAQRYPDAEFLVKLIGTALTAVGVVGGLIFGICAMGQPARLREAKELSDLVGYRNLAFTAFRVTDWALVCGSERGAVPADEMRFKNAQDALDAIKLGEIVPPTLTQHFLHIRYLTDRTRRWASVAEKAEFVATVNDLKDSLHSIDLHLIATAKVEFDDSCFARRGRRSNGNDRCTGYWKHFVPGTTNTSELQCSLIGTPRQG